MDSDTLARVTQLINKTNQFNLATRRYTEEQVQAMMESAHRWFYWFRLRDRFANHGLIGVLLANRGPEVWTVDTWLMSCRVIGRGVEEFMFQKLLEAARSAAATTLRASYIPTAKNDLVRDLLPRLGFQEIQPGHFELVIPPDAAVAPRKFHFAEG